LFTDKFFKTALNHRSKYISQKESFFDALFFFFDKKDFGLMESHFHV